LSLSFSLCLSLYACALKLPMLAISGAKHQSQPSHGEFIAARCTAQAECRDRQED
jgi:hypothetical protein